MKTAMVRLLKHKHRSALVFLCFLGFLLLLLSPAWASPRQRPHRQTVPDVTPEAYLPVVFKEEPTPTPTNSLEFPRIGR